MNAPAYRPASSVGYVNRTTHKVAIGKIDDQRNVAAEVFFASGIDPFKSKFNKPIGDVVREALRFELSVAGRRIVERSEADLVLESNILQFICTESSVGFAKKHQLVFIVEIEFRWLSSVEGKLLRKNTRVRHFRMDSVFPRGFDFSTNIMHEELLAIYGKTLVTRLLSDVIRLELMNFPQSMAAGNRTGSANTKDFIKNNIKSTAILFDDRGKKYVLLFYITFLIVQ